MIFALYRLAPVLAGLPGFYGVVALAGEGQVLDSVVLDASLTPAIDEALATPFADMLPRAWSPTGVCTLIGDDPKAISYTVNALLHARLAGSTLTLETLRGAWEAVGHADVVN